MGIFGAVLMAGCAYNVGYGHRSLPGGFDRVAIPVFKNRSDIVGIEAAFANSMIRQFANSKVAKVVDRDSAPLVVEGEIVSIELIHEGRIDRNQLSPQENTFGLPQNTVLTSQYRVLANVALQLRRSDNQKVLWTGTVRGERVYPAPQVGQPIVNSVNPLYNHNARIDVIEQMSQQMMAEGHDRMTENF